MFVVLPFRLRPISNPRSEDNQKPYKNNSMFFSS